MSKEDIVRLTCQQDIFGSTNVFMGEFKNSQILPEILLSRFYFMIDIMFGVDALEEPLLEIVQSYFHD